MPKTIAITPSWYWPAGTTRVTGVPPFGIHEILVDRFARHRPDAPALVSGDDRVTGAELADRVHAAAAALRGRLGDASCVHLYAGATVEGVVLLLAALAADARVRLLAAGAAPDPPLAGEACATIALADGAGAAAASADGRQVVRLAELCAAPRGSVQDPEGERRIGLGDAAVALPGAPGGAAAWHSHHSLLATAVSIATFLQLDASLPWVSAQPLATWEGLAGVMAPLLAGTTVVLPGAEPLPQAAAREAAGYVFADLETVTALTRDAKRDVKNLRGALRLLLLSVAGAFDPDMRRRVGRSFDCAALTMYGSVETGPVFASHPSWYVDESVGIPITNAHVVPVDPRSHAPLQTLWELVEFARVSVRSPASMVGYDRASGLDEPTVDGRFLMPMLASSDANGMIYLLPDEV
ncbi:MAG: AMP-binding protein [Acidimicrobiia bacterium]|nr:AMP-binding protein [Acidimicrobiia bacterium]